jgi:hypothetical protein
MAVPGSTLLVLSWTLVLKAAGNERSVSADIGKSSILPAVPQQMCTLDVELDADDASGEKHVAAGFDGTEESAIH